MRRLLFVIPAAAMFAVAMLAMTSGCSKPADKVEPTADAKKADAKDTSAKPAAQKTAIKAGDGVIKGKIVFAGDPPKLEVLPQLKDPKTPPQCIAKDEKQNVDQRWLIGTDKGVANVVIYLKAPADAYFEPSDADKKRTEPAVIDQPHCAFLPHVTAVYPFYNNGKKLEPTGQVLQVKNSAGILHNVKSVGNPLLGKSNTFDEPVKPDDKLEITYKPQTDPVSLSCSVHQWMSAKVWVFDHPYAVVTKEDGTFEIKNVPNDTKLQLEIWHESPGVFEKKTIELKKGGTEDLKTVSVK